MNKKQKLIIIAIMLCTLLVMFATYRINQQWNEVYKFVKTYKIYDSFNKQIIQDTVRDSLQEFTIKGNWLISVDPNNSWIRVQYDPNWARLKTGNN